MRYLGGKHRVGKKLAAVIEFYEPVHYHEPFCGMFGVGKYVNALVTTASDVHPDLILLLRAIRDGWQGPDYVTEERFYELKYATEPSAERGFIGFGCSFGGMFFNCPARYPAKGETINDFANVAKRSMARMRPLIQGVDFQNHSYLDYAGQADLLYCDPPYADTTGYSLTGHNGGKFNPREFWDWVWKQSRNRVVLVSELTCPDPRAKIVFEFPLTHTNCRTKTLRVAEKVFTFN